MSSLPFIVGILGGVASGKSLVTEMLSDWGAEVFDADRAGHEALADTSVRHCLGEVFGLSILNEAGQVSREKLAELVFGPEDSSETNRKILESVTHPWIKCRWATFFEAATRRGAKLVVLDAPLLLETGLADTCDAILFVDTPAAWRLQFASQRGWTPQQWSAREQRQTSLEEKRDAATWILDNSRDPAFLKSQLRSFLKAIFRLDAPAEG